MPKAITADELYRTKFKASVVALFMSLLFTIAAGGMFLSHECSMNVIVEWCLVESGRPWFPWLKLQGGPACHGCSGGLIVGQVAFTVPLLAWLSGRSDSSDSIERAVGKAVSETLKFCLESELGVSTPTYTTSKVWSGLDSWNSVILPISVVALGLLGVCCVGCIVFWGLRRWRLQEAESSPENSPRSPQPSIGDLARNQLAELRVRRHAHQSHRAIGI